MAMPVNLNVIYYKKKMSNFALNIIFEQNTMYTKKMVKF